MLVEGHHNHLVAELGNSLKLNLLLFGLNADQEREFSCVQPRTQFLEERVKQRLALFRQSLETNREPGERMIPHILH